MLVLGIGNLEKGEIFESLRKSSYFYGGPKFWCYGMTGNYDSNNYRILRYGDAVLMKAECLFRLSRQSESVEYINKVRARAYTNPNTGIVAPAYEYKYTTDDELFKMIRDERARELGGEFQRKFDLVRWGIWFDETKKYNLSDKLIDNMRECHRFYPIPETECALSGILKNEEYND